MAGLVLDSVDAAPPDARRGRRKGLALGFVAGFVLTAWVVRTTVAAVAPGLPHEPGRAEYNKAWVFDRHGDEFDLIFVGTSKVKGSIDPERFDRAAAARGLDIRSFNYGLPGMRHMESHALVRRILDREPERLRWLVVELTGEITMLHEYLVHRENALTPRTIEWHRPSITLRASRALLDDPRVPVADRIEGVGSHVQHALLRASGVGLLGNAVDAASTDVRAGGEWNGFLAINFPAVTQGMIEQGERGPSWLERARKARGELDTHAAPDDDLADSLAALVARAREVDVPLIFIRLPPHWDENVAMYTESNPRGLPVLWDFSDPDAYPEFYDPALWYNPIHLNGAGAERFTDTIAARFLDWLEARTGSR